MADRIRDRIGGDPLDPGLEVVLRHPAQHRVDQADRPGSRPRPGQVDRRRDRGVRADAHPQQLVGAQAQHVADPRLHGAAGEAGVDDRVVGALPAQGPRRELGREAGVTPGQPVLAECLRQDQVGVGVLGPDRPHDVVRRQPGRVSHRRSVL